MNTFTKSKNKHKHGFVILAGDAEGVALKCCGVGDGSGEDGGDGGGGWGFKWRHRFFSKALSQTGGGHP